MRLRVSIGSSKDDLQTAWVNVDDKPTEINSKYWVGRVLVRVKDFDGFTPDGSPPATESEYFEGRNRRFHIQAEGRFKKAYNGDEVWFGTQFDHMIANFPETLFNAGMRIAKYIDPAVFYDKSSHTPYIMSPYLACVNTLSAWPAPHRSQDAVLALENGNAVNDSDEEEGENDVPREEVQHNKHSAPPKPIRYWSFQGFREDETSNTLQRKPTRESLLLEERMGTVEEDGFKEGSIRTQSTRYDGDRMVTAENPNHRLALTRLGSYGRDTNVVRSSLTAVGGPTLDAFPEDISNEDDIDDDADSFYTAAEYIFENEVQPDGTVVPVKKKKSGLSVKKVRKSLHIPSAKTIEKNMRGLSIKRKDKSDKRVDSMGSENDRGDASRNSTEPSSSRKSIDLMRPFRFGHHDKDNSTNSRKSAQLEREKNTRSPQLPKTRTSISEDRDFSSKPQVHHAERLSAATQPAIRDSTRTERRPQTHDHFKKDVQPALASALSPIQTSSTSSDHQGSNSETLSNLRTQSTVTSSAYEAPQGAMQSLHSIEDSARLNSPNQTSNVESTGQPPQVGSIAHNSTTMHDFTGEASGPTAQVTPEDDGISHKLDADLGPWRFTDPRVEPIEDTAFIFGDTSHSVKDRRKHFAKSEEKRQEFEFDPDIVYCMSFFLPYMNFNTFDLKLGPLGANLHKYVDDQPVRYMARSASRPEEVFFMVEFGLE